VHRLTRAADGRVLLGLRPEAFQDAELLGETAQPVLEGEVEIVEQLGPETHAYLRLAPWRASELTERPRDLAGTFAARLDPRSRARPGAHMKIAVDLSQCHLFDPEGGESLLDGDWIGHADLERTSA
jgi:multiple sugar transport system ATP-binding protein